MSWIEKVWQGSVSHKKKVAIGYSRTINSQTFTDLEDDASGNVLRATGTVVITNGGAGYAKGCAYTKTDVAGGTDGSYRNIGTTASCEFALFDSVSPGEIALADGDILVGNGSAVAAGVTMSGDATIANTGVITVASSAAGFQLGGKLSFAVNGGAASASGLLMGVGTSVAPASTAVAGSIFAEFRTQSTATSGDSRGLYWRHDINGAGGGGEAIRAFAKVTAAASTVRGAHISLDLDAAGTVSGFGAAVDAQVLIGDASITSNVNCLNAELYAAGSSTSIAARSASILRVVFGGAGAGVADMLGKTSFLRFENAAASGGFVDSDITALTGKAGLRVTDNTGALYGYIPIVTGS